MLYRWFTFSGRSSLSKKEEPLHASLVGLLLRQKSKVSFFFWSDSDTILIDSFIKQLVVTLRTMPSYDSALVRQLESQLNQLPSNTQTQVSACLSFYRISSLLIVLFVAIVRPI